MINMEMVRGDNKSFKFQRKDSNGDVIETVCDEVYFTVKPSTSNTAVTFQKKLSDGTITFDESDFYYRFEILPADTNGLDYRSYAYDIERILTGKKQTISLGTLTITDEVTFASNESEA
jgi:hypothetical protein